MLADVDHVKLDGMTSIYRLTFQSKNPKLVQDVITGVLIASTFLYGALQERWVIKMSGFSPAIALFVTHSFCWLLVAMGLLIAYVSLEEWIRHRAQGLVLEVTNEGLLLPCGFAGLKNFRILYQEIIRIEEEMTSSRTATVLHVVTRNRHFAISSSWFPNQDAFDWFRTHLYTHAPHQQAAPF